MIRSINQFRKKYLPKLYKKEQEGEETQKGWWRWKKKKE